jgi:hypothetical protein
MKHFNVARITTHQVSLFGVVCLLAAFGCSSGKLLVKASEELISRKLSKLPDGPSERLQIVGSRDHCSDFASYQTWEAWLLKQGYLQCTEKPDENNPGSQFLVITASASGRKIFPVKPKPSESNPNLPWYLDFETIKIGTYKVVVDEAGSNVSNPSSVPFHIERIFEPVWLDAVKSTNRAGAIESDVANFRKETSGVARFVRNANGNWELLDIQPLANGLKELL